MLVDYQIEKLKHEGQEVIDFETQKRIELEVNFYVEILSELITNGVLHSKSNTYALMFVNRYGTKFSISDNGIGFEQSLKEKTEDSIYKPNELKSELDLLKVLSVHRDFINNLNYIIETLYYSSIKNRSGLFDLMVSVVLDYSGYFRLHSDNAQIIISNRMAKDLTYLRNLRIRILDIHREILIKGDEHLKQKQLIELKDNIKNSFVELYKNICKNYNENYRYSSIRFFNIRFKGVHIEVEMPNLNL